MSADTGRRDAARDRAIGTDGSDETNERGSRWLGAGLILVMSVCALWLTVTGQLAIYVNPGNTPFIATMSSIAVVLSVAVLARPRVRHDHHHEHEHDHEHEHPHLDDLVHEVDGSTSALTGDPRPTRRVLSGVLGVATAAFCAIFALAFLVLPPRALSASVAEIRDVNGGLLLTDATDQTVQLAADADYSTYGLREWAALLRQSTHPESLIATPFEAIGFVTASDESEDSFVLTRFVVSHCAIDAQPVGVTVYSPGWEERFEVGAWVTVDGSFATAPDSSAGSPVSVAPESVDPTPEPDVPYEY
ncbi:TIGR03943 family putative permease subunit [Labedella endophytica]|uniref:TIGR03943 family protein n=1 Tax=Labedella endophytica TaxID=1523160 RepID=A0A3S1CU81_9MICO|nr:TIGR03943 family protein [Labedella endophytica]RUR03236.1 TIGR03943 family protein [Labedella endophytica]